MNHSITITTSEMLRISPLNSTLIECKGVGMGHIWRPRYSSRKKGNFLELKFYEEVQTLVLKTEKGMYTSYSALS